MTPSFQPFLFIRWDDLNQFLKALRMPPVSYLFNYFEEETPSYLLRNSTPNKSGSELK